MSHTNDDAGGSVLLTAQRPDRLVSVAFQVHVARLLAAAFDAERLDNLGVSTTAPVPVAEATWLVQASTTEPFSMACSTEGTLNLNNNGPSTLQLAKVTGPVPCPGTPITNNSLDLTADRQ
jgi:hypothetical protein